MFREFDGAGIKGGRADVSADVLRCGSAWEISLSISGEVVVECDRCLEDCTLPVNYRGALMVRFSDAPAGEDDGQTLWLPVGQGELDLARYIYESIVLALPYRRVHPSDVHGRPLCNPAMLERFRMVTQQEFDSLVTRSRSSLEDNPALQALRDAQDRQTDKND